MQVDLDKVERFIACGIPVLPQDVAALIARVRELEAERRWIPVSEGLPEPGKSGDYFVIEELPMGLRCVAIRTWLRDRSTYGWQRPSGFPVTHYRLIGPLPEVHE